MINPIWNQVRRQVHFQVRRLVYGQIQDQVRRLVLGQVLVQVRGQVYVQAWDQVRDMFVRRNEDDKEIKDE